MRLALGIEYDGSGFSGWQSQPHRNTVQDVLEQALSQIAAKPIQVMCAGRTDAGVHALGQVVHFDTEAQRPLNAWVRGANVFLPPSVAVTWAHPVDEDFHARFSARSRSYRYVLLDRPVRTAVDHGKLGWFHHRLDVAAMAEAAKLLLGQHDFSAFRAAECQAKTPIKTLHQADVRRDGQHILFEFRADAFLQHMVRNMVGSLVYVGKGAHRPEWLAELLASRQRTRAAPTFSPHGLYLTAVEYDQRWQLPV